MGQSLGLTCAGCGYTVETSGGNDVGMACATTTIVCVDCQAIYDVVISEEPWRVMDGEPGEIAIVCPKRKRHTVRPWTHPGACPKCGAAMEPNGTYILWD